MKNRDIVIAPASCKSYLTAGKEYEITDVDKKGIVSFNIIDDTGAEIFCVLEWCCHLYYGDWIIKNK